MLPFAPRDLYPLGRNDDPLRAHGVVEAEQRGINTGLLYFRIDEPAFGNVLYVQNLSASNDYFRATGTKPLTEAAELGFDAFYTPTLTDFADMRVYGEAYVKLKLVGDLLALRLTAADEYDSRPQPGIQNNDVGVFSTIEVTWGK